MISTFQQGDQLQTIPKSFDHQQLPPFDEDRLTRKEAAKYLGLSPATLATDASRQHLGIPYYRAGKVFYRRSELDEWLKTRKKT